jgi:hypothetical protein
MSAPAAPFDWSAWDAQFDRQQLALKQSLERWNEAEAALAQARVEMARDVRKIIGEA